jgi:hypothetical protein
VAEETDDAVAVIAQLVDRLGVPFRDVIAAAGIKKSTFYSWKLPHSPRPRLSSQGQLWALVQTVDDLDETLGGGIRRWLRMDAHRRTLLKAGNFGGLLALVTADRPRPASAEYVAAYAVGGDRDASAPELTPRAPVRRKAVTAQVRGAAHRRHG